MTKKGLLIYLSTELQIQNFFVGQCIPKAVSLSTCIYKKNLDSTPMVLCLYLIVKGTRKLEKRSCLSWLSSIFNSSKLAVAGGSFLTQFVLYFEGNFYDLLSTVKKFKL